MFKRSKNGRCVECGTKVSQRPARVEFHGQEIYLLHPSVCNPCLLNTCEKYAVPCANCGDPIPPYSQVGVLKGNAGENHFVHMTAACCTVGSAFHGYWGKGKLSRYVEIEAC